MYICYILDRNIERRRLKKPLILRNIGYVLFLFNMAEFLKSLFAGFFQTLAGTLKKALSLGTATKHYCSSTG